MGKDIGVIEEWLAGEEGKGRMMCVGRERRRCCDLNASMGLRRNRDCSRVIKRREINLILGEVFSGSINMNKEQDFFISVTF